MDAQSNGHTPPTGYQTPVYRAMTQEKIIAGVPRPVMGVIVMFCAGLYMVTKSWGAVLVYLLLHTVAAAFTWRDPQWPQVLKESLQYRYRIWRLSFHPTDWRRVQWTLGIGGAVLVVCLYLAVFAWR